MLFFILSSCKKEDDGLIINDQVFSIDENSTSGTFMGQVVTDKLAGWQTLTFSILSGNTNDAFEISETDGTLTVHNEEALDYETTKIFTLTVQVKDIQNKYATAKIKIKLNDLEPPKRGLLLYYPFNGNLNDLSAYKNNRIDFTSQNYVTGIKSQALDFNGTTDYIRLTYSINSQKGLSFSFWLKTKGANGKENNGAIVSKYSMVSHYRCFMIYSFGAYETRNDNRLSAAFYKYGTSSGIHDHVQSFMEPGELTIFPNPGLWTISHPTRLVPGDWTHCVVNVTDTTIETWINGEKSTIKQREYSTYFDNKYEPIFIGNNVAGGEGSNNHFNGILDELRIYNRGLTDVEIRTLFKE